MENRQATLKSKQVVVNIEEEFYEAFLLDAQRKGLSASKLGRRLIVQYLIREGYLKSDIALGAML